MTQPTAHKLLISDQTSGQILAEDHSVSKDEKIAAQAFFGKSETTATMFSKTSCPYCDEARAFLAANDLPCTEIKLDDPAERAAMYDRFGLTGSARTVPQIVITADGEEYRIGGAQELRISGIASLFVDIKDLTTLRTAVSFEVSRDFVGVLAIEGSACCE